MARTFFALVDAGGVGESKMRNSLFPEGRSTFGEGDVEVRVDVDDLARAAGQWEKCEQSLLAASKMGVGDNDAGAVTKNPGRFCPILLDRRRQAWLGGRALRARVRVGRPTAASGNLAVIPPVKVSEMGCRST